MLLRIIHFLVLGVILIGCSSLPNVPGESTNNNVSEPQSRVYPGIDHPDFSEYAETIEVPEVTKDKGIVTGILLDSEERKPYITTLLLGKIVYASDPVAPPLIEYSLDTSPIAKMSKQGFFVFDKVDPGEYGIVIWSPVNAVLLEDPATGEFLQVSVVAGQITDLGTVFVK